MVCHMSSTSIAPEPVVAANERPRARVYGDIEIGETVVAALPERERLLRQPAGSKPQQKAQVLGYVEFKPTAFDTRSR